MTLGKLKLILMGTGPFAVPSFDALHRAGHEIATVVTRPVVATKSRSGPPPSPVRQWASDRGLALIDPESINSPAAVAAITAIGADLMVVCDYGQILKPEALAAARWGGINLHGSLLPAYRGAAPVQRAVLSGDIITGVSVIHMTPRLDGGPILTTRSTPISNSETSGELEQRLSQIGVAATLEAIEMLIHHDGKGLAGQPQDPAKISKAPRLTKAEAAIDWSQTGRMIDVHVRGMQPWPVAFCHVETAAGKLPLRLAILRVRSEVDPSTDAADAGKLLPSDELAVGCGDGRIVIEQLQPAGKKPMSGREFLRGYPMAAGTRFA